jgi:hypothetical protein
MISIGIDYLDLLLCGIRIGVVIHLSIFPAFNLALAFAIALIKIKQLLLYSKYFCL